MSNIWTYAFKRRHFKGLLKASKSLSEIKIDKDALDLIATMSNGDFRFAINLLEVAYYSSSDKK